MFITNKFIIIIPVYNAGDLIIPALMSVIGQDFDDLGIIIRDDMSTDNTYDNIKSILQIEGDEIQTKINGKDIIYIKNKTKMYPCGNTYDSVINYVRNDNAIIGVVDGDDSLTNSKAVSRVYREYVENDKWLVWTQHVNSDGSGGQSKPLPPDSIIYSNRGYWSVTHFRTSKAFLFHKINKNDLLDPFIENSYYSFAGDAAFLFPFIEMCGNEKSSFINEVFYLYNNQLPSNEHNKSMENAIKYGSYIRNNGVRYSKITL